MRGWDGKERFLVFLARFVEQNRQSRRACLEFFFFFVAVELGLCKVGWAGRPAGWLAGCLRLGKRMLCSE